MSKLQQVSLAGVETKIYPLYRSVERISQEKLEKITFLFNLRPISDIVHMVGKALELERPQWD